MASNQSPSRHRVARWITGALILAPLSMLSAQVTVKGTVFDSLAKRPLAHATVNLVFAARQTSAMVATTDSLGNFAIPNVPPGDYIAGFFHPLLDSLGIAAPLRRVHTASSDVSIALAIPGPRRLQEAICGREADDDSAAVLVGEVRDAATRAVVAGATVSARWLNFVVGDRRLVPRSVTPTVVTDGNGRFAICGVPSAIDVVVQTTHGADSSGAVALTMGSGEIDHRVVYLGRSTARLHGRVSDAQTGLPLAGARITVVGSAATASSNDSGTFEIAQAPAGTQEVGVHAIGFLPQVHVVDVLPGDDPPREFAMENTQTVLDTIRITAQRLDLTGFAERRHSASGKFFDQNDITHLRPRSISQLMQYAPQVHRFGTTIMAKGLMDFCNPSVFVDGRLYIDGRRDSIKERDLDLIAWPEDIAGLEVYRASETPPQFQLMTSLSKNPWCGAIVIWRRPAQPRKK